MVSERAGPPPAAAEGTGGYIHGYGAPAVAVWAARSAEREAAFFLPHLRPGMRLLDAGCGPGTITVGLAAAVAPGEVVGLELSPAMVEQARALASERGVANVRFEVGDAQALPVPDAPANPGRDTCDVFRLGSVQSRRVSFDRHMDRRTGSRTFNGRRRYPGLPRDARTSGHRLGGARTRHRRSSARRAVEARATSRRTTGRLVF